MGVKSHISKTVASSWLSLVITSACQLVMIPIALGALDKTDFALFAVISQMLTAVMLAEVGIRSACARLLIDARAKGENEYNKVWMASVCVFCMQAAFMLLLIVLLAPFLDQIFHLEPEQRSLAYGVFLAVGIINTLGYMLSIFSTALLAGQKLSHINIIASIVSLVQLVIFIVAIKMGFKLWAYPISMGAALIFSQSLLVSRAFKANLVGKFSWKLLDWHEVKVIFRLGMDVFVAALFSVVMGHSLLIFSGHLLTLEQTAILAVNLKLVNMMTQILHRIPGSAEPMLMKMVSEGDNEQFRIWWKLIAKITISLAIFSAGMFVFWNKLIIVTWTSEEMVMTGLSLILLSLVPFRYLTHYIFVNSLAIFKEIRKVKLMLLWEIVLYACLAFALGSHFGLVGLLSANLLSMFGGALLRGMKFFAVYSQISFQSLFLIFFRIVFPLVTIFAVISYLGSGPEYQGMYYSSWMSFLWCMISVLVGYFVIFDSGDRERLQSFVASIRNSK